MIGYRSYKEQELLLQSKYDSVIYFKSLTMSSKGSSSVQVIKLPLPVSMHPIHFQTGL
jgi:hypothetical protein